MSENPGTSCPQLFLDERWIEDATFVSRVWHQPKKYPDAVLVSDQPWERMCPIIYGTVLYWQG
ncbi:MAG: hypothetical protein AUJ92_09565 [Armatimonadetes bacterium CG2_30_59_28]|nr:hypothetical protein [Armatimonadota bacterium]OIO94658.1 MAG: hypothetical protein AUJ92_09565 [Armatimonadetes bacterium CG2_30_59_28]PIU61811.1 MAG: hypothetical protein COS85_20295 [Armatimonadetes bacterium CG07_land_8_20_14_0_80_59_28]PIX38323.1 MAG: hypothetical protein COZ56_20725 [Armatimonadetes bacterium CG_4_8_14_3_um_filter_58_9]PJB77254.1 MAG: hypothetical protein CO095_01670 [Armatimonadetes bacterium CG_4_9_14_3_um_filter_58_7]